MNVQRNGRAVAAAAATAFVASATLAGGQAQATPAQAGAVVVGDVLTISGTNAADQITLDFTALDSVVVDLGGSNGTRRFASGSFHAAAVDLRSGDDQFRTISGGVLVDVPTTVSAGNGNDIATTGAGTRRPGRRQRGRLRQRRRRHRLEVLGNGDDTAAWNPGDGNDTIDGGLGRDTLAFNGSNGDELMSLSANGPSAVFLRNLGNIRMDLDGVERLDLATFGGVDTVTIGDLSGTDVTTADIDLAATTGAADAKDDTVQVNGTNQADRVDVTADGGAVEVTGLAAQTSVTGGDPTDRLQINTLGGDDTRHRQRQRSRAAHHPAMTSNTTKEITMNEFPGFTHVAVTVSDLARSTAWYADLFGSAPVLDEDVAAGSFHHTVFAIGGGNLFGLHVHAEPSSAPFDERGPGLDHVSFACGDRAELEKWSVRLDELGIAHGEIVDAPYGSGLSFRDPDGIALEFFAPPA